MLVQLHRAASYDVSHDGKPRRNLFTAAAPDRR
jgi:hypothetical protein